MLHVDLTVPLLVLASPLVILGLLRMVASIADQRVKERSDALVRDLERIPVSSAAPPDGGATSESRSAAEEAAPLTRTNDAPQG